MKQIFKKIIVGGLGRQVLSLRAHSDFTIVAVAGSIGKSSTKRAIAQVLKAGKRVQWQDGNYNDLVSVPLVFFGLELPSKLFSPFGWLKIFIEISRQLKQPYPYDVVVLELGTDEPGQIADFAKYLKVDISIITAIAPEHMENFEDLEAVAREEFSIKGFTKQLIIDIDMVAAQYLNDSEPFLSYSIKNPSDAHLQFKSKKIGSFDINLNTKRQTYQALLPFIGEHQLHAVAAAGLVGELCGLNREQIESGIASLTPMPGRMQVLKGKQGSLIIDDTYNASPEAMIAALKVLYSISTSKRIALLGNMNELGSVSADHHKEVGAFCDPNFLDLVVTLGADANKYLADFAEQKGCKVIRTSSPYEAGQLIEKALVKDTVVLAKGSQNGVYAEEAVRILLADPSDSAKLVRQSPKWLKYKQHQFRKST